MKQLSILLMLFVRPKRAASDILDHGSLLFGAIAVVVVSAVLSMSAVDLGESDDEGPPVAELSSSSWVQTLNEWGDQVVAGPVGNVARLSVLYSPALLLLATFLSPIGSFGVAFRRDFGVLLTSVYFCWVAAYIPVALFTLKFGLTGLLSLGGALLFVVLLTPVLNIVLGMSLGRAALAGLGAFASFALAPFLHVLASPFLLYFAWSFLAGNLSDVQWSFQARRAQRRYLEAATLNPRDAEAHIQLGLVHLQRRQVKEAQERFEKAAAIDPTDPDARFQLGILARKGGRNADAIQHFQAVINKDERFSRHEVWREIGANYLDAKAYENALPALERFVTERAHDPQGLVLLGETLLALGRKADGDARFKEAIEAAETAPRYLQHELRPWRDRARKHLKG